MQYVYSVEELRYGGSGVYTPTGNFNETCTDILTYDGEGSVKVERTYNSKDSLDSHFGRGWFFSFEGSVKNLERKFLQNMGTIITKTDTKVKTVRFGNGTTALFELQSDNTTSETLDSRNVLVKNSGGNVTEYERDDNGNIIKTTSPDGTVSETLYDEKNNVVWTIDEAGIFTTYTYGDYGNVASITNPDGSVKTYEYDSVNR